MRLYLIRTKWHSLIVRLSTEMTALYLLYYLLACRLRARTCLLGLLLVNVLLKIPILIILWQSINSLHLCVLCVIVEAIFNYFLRQFFWEAHGRLGNLWHVLGLKDLLVLWSIWQAAWFQLLIREYLVSTIEINRYAWDGLRLRITIRTSRSIIEIGNVSQVRLFIHLMWLRVQNLKFLIQGFGVGWRLEHLLLAHLILVLLFVAQVTICRHCFGRIIYVEVVSELVSHWG